MPVGGDVDFSEVMPLASGSRTKKMQLGVSRSKGGVFLSNWGMHGANLIAI
jgi:hypothetical protein